MESLAESGLEAEQFLDALNGSHDVASLWEPEEVLYARARILETLGRSEQAAAVLEALGHRLATKGEAHHLDEAADLVERIRGLGVEPDSSLTVRVADATDPEPTGETSAIAARVFFLGGNEVQKRYDDHVQKWAGEQWPHLELDIDHPGWSSNWGRRTEEFKHRIQKAEAVVLMRYVRTNLGRLIRRICGECDVPWVACTGHGRDAMKRSIGRAARVIASQQERLAS